MIKFLILLDFVLLVHGQLNPNQSPDYVVNNVCFCVTKGSCVDGRPSNNSNNANNNSNSLDLEPSDGSLDSRIFFFATSTTRRTTTVRSTRRVQQSNSNGNGMNFFQATTQPPMIPASPGEKLVVNNQTSCAAGLELCCPSQGFFCGTRYPPVQGAPTPTDPSQSPYGGYPWDVAVLSSFTDEYIASGALIDHRHVVTVAHKVYKSADLKCRFGEWNIQSNFEPFPAQEVDVEDEGIIIHPEFKSLRTLLNNIAILRLEAPGVQLGLYPTITNICLPSQPLANMRCWVAGWGKSDFQSNTYQTVLKHVSLSLIEYWTCQNMLRNTRLGPRYNLDPLSFICAGGEQNKDACTGDGGAALACEIDGHFYLAGLVAWGIGCGTLNVPGVYINIYNFVPWIQSVVKKTYEMSLDLGDFTTSRSSTFRSGLNTTTVISSTTRLTTTLAPTTKPAVTNAPATTVRPLNTTVTTLATTTSTRPVVTNAPAATTRLLNTTVATTVRSVVNTTVTTPAATTVRSGQNTTTVRASQATTTKPGATTERTTVRASQAATTKPGVTTVRTTVRSNTNTTRASGNVTTRQTVRGSQAVTTKPGATTIRTTVRASQAATTKPGATTARTTARGNQVTTKPGATTRTTPRATTRTVPRTTARPSGHNLDGPNQDYVANNVCFCVTKGSCIDGTPWNNGNNSNSNGNNANSSGNSRPPLEPSDGSLDPRFVFQTASSTTRLSSTRPSRNVGSFLLTTTQAPVLPASSGQKLVVENQTSCAAGLELCCPVQGYSCGTRFPPAEGAPVPSESSQSEYGAYPWHVAVLSTITLEYIGAGVLIDHRHVLTVAHKIYQSTYLKCRFGEWNAFANDELFPPQEVDVIPEGIIIHPEFKSLRTLWNDIAILRLEAPGVRLGVYPTITNICLPSQPILNMRCWVSGWGQWKFQNSSFQAYLKQVNLPLVEHFTCQDMLRKTRLGEGFFLNALSFICAGGEENNDACIGDGGSALACEIDGHFYLAGLVAWGIGCGTLNVPGAYVNIYSYVPWIQSVIHQHLDGSHDVEPKDTSNRSATSNAPRLSNNTITMKSTVRSLHSTLALTSSSRSPIPTITMTTKSQNTSVSTSRSLNSTIRSGLNTTLSTPRPTLQLTSNSSPSTTPRPSINLTTRSPASTVRQTLTMTTSRGVTTRSQATVRAGSGTRMAHNTTTNEPTAVEILNTPGFEE